MTERKKRRHVAKGARIVVAGIGATTTLGLVGVMGYSKQASDAAPTAPPARAGQPPIVVVIHHADSPGVGVNATPATLGLPAAGDANTVTALKARPTVRPATTRSSAPAASTSGSR